MDDARHYRERAAVMLSLAAQISDTRAAANLRSVAVQYHALAAKLDAEPASHRQPVESPQPAHRH